MVHTQVVAILEAVARELHRSPPRWLLAIGIISPAREKGPRRTGRALLDRCAVAPSPAPVILSLSRATTEEVSGEAHEQQLQGWRLPGYGPCPLGGVRLRLLGRQ